jgi:hypothetical protein
MNPRFSTRRPKCGAAAEAKKQAKRLGGNAIFVERRRLAVQDALLEQ